MIMSIIKRIKNLFKRTPKKMYFLIDTFGCTEVPPQDCPTFLERDVHRKFKNALDAYNIIVVYGESRQGKTWTIEKYCPDQLRIGCNADMDLPKIKTEMLHVLKMDVLPVEHSITEEYSEGEKTTTVTDGGMSFDFNTAVSAQLNRSAGFDVTNSISHKETVKTNYLTVDPNSSTDFLNTILDHSEGKYFVFDNFHYLQPSVQQQFCSLLKEFNYRGIKVIIVGVWKDASRITSLAPDLVNRCQHIDIGSWQNEELNNVVEKGEKALNIEIGESVKALFVNCCASNIGIFKDFLQKLCQRYEIEKTQEKHCYLNSDDIAQSVAEEVVNEAYKPLHDRVVNLALPQREKKASKHMRQKIIISILELILNSEIESTQEGIGITAIKNQIDQLCDSLGDERINISNLTQELGLLHQREENRQTGGNYISLFFFDKTNKKLLVLEPTIYEIMAFNSALIQELIDELKEGIKSPETQQMCLFEKV